MRRLDLSLQELGSARLLVYNGDVNDLDNNINHRNILSYQMSTFVDVPICYFDMTELVPLSEIQKYTLDKFDLLNMLKISTEVVNHAIKQNKDLKSILFSSDYVYLDGDFNTYFIPLRTNDDGNDYKIFLKNMVANSIVAPTNNDNYLQFLLNCLNDPGFSVEYLSKMVQQLITNHPVDFINTTRPIRNTPSSPQRQPRQETPQHQPKTPYPSFFFPNTYKDEDSTQNSRPSSHIDQSPPASFLQETNNVSQMNQNNIQRSSTNQPSGVNTAYLISEDDQNQKIIIDTKVFAIGRNPEIVNFPINSPYIGRLHAIIKSENGAYSIIDKNSTNGTYLNGHRLQAEFSQVLQSGDIVKLAKHSFLFNEE